MLKHLKWGALISSIIYIAAGVLLIIYPEASAKVICDIIGIACIITGLISITTYFMLDIRESLYRNDFVSGVLIVLLGILIIYKKDEILKLIPFILGIVIFVSGFSKLQDGIDANRIGYKKSWIYIIMAAISIAFGLVIMFSLPASTTNKVMFTVIGAGLLYSGATDLYSTLYLSGKIKKFMKKVDDLAKNGGEAVIDAQAEEEPQPEQKPEEPHEDTEKPEDKEDKTE